MVDLPGVHAIDCVTLCVPDLEGARKFYGAFGLNVTESRDGLDVRGCDGRHPELRVVEGATRRLHALSLLADDEALEAITRRCDVSGGRCDAPSWSRGEPIWLRDPDGNLVSVRAAPQGDRTRAPALGLTAPATPRRSAPAVGPQRLSHALLFTPDVPGAVGFYSRVLGVRLSDRAADIIAFTHGVAGGDHHMVAFAKSQAPGFHHVSWQTASLDDVGLGARRMQEAGYPEGWGVGRHVLGSNYFYYVRDPWGSFCEFSYGIDQIEGDKAWVAQDHAPEDALYLWGPDVPDFFLQNAEA